MTLAEVFLLLLIVGWYGMRLESEGPPVIPATPEAVLREQLREAQTKLDAAEKARKDLELQVKEHQRILDWLQSHYGGPILDLEGLQKLVKSREDAVRSEGKRGKPACQTANVIARVVVDGDIVTVTLLNDFTHEGRTFPRNTLLDSEAGAAGWLKTVEAYYATRRRVDSNCAFDYELQWRSDRDYRVGRQLFENYFYPAKVTQLQ